MGRYRQIDPKVHDDEKFIELSDSQQLLWLTLLSGPQCSIVPGLMVGGLATLSEVRRRPAEDVRRDLDELMKRGMVEVDDKRRMIRLPKGPKYTELHNAKQLVGWFRAWKDLPESDLKYRHVESLRKHISPDGDWFPETWKRTFGTVQIPTSLGIDTVSKANGGDESAPGNGIKQKNPNESVSIPYRTQDHDHDHDHEHTHTQEQGVCDEKSSSQEQRKPEPAEPPPRDDTTSDVPSAAEVFADGPDAILLAEWNRQRAKLKLPKDRLTDRHREAFTELLTQTDSDPDLAVESVRAYFAWRDPFLVEGFWTVNIFPHRISGCVAKAREWLDRARRSNGAAPVVPADDTPPVPWEERRRALGLPEGTTLREFMTGAVKTAGGAT